MTAHGRKAVVKTWFELIKLTHIERGVERMPDVETTSFGHFPVQAKAHDKAHKLGLHEIFVPLSSEDSYEQWFVNHSVVDESGYYVKEVDLVHEYGRKTLGRVVTSQWVHTRKTPRGGPRQRKDRSL